MAPVAKLTTPLLRYVTTRDSASAAKTAPFASPSSRKMACWSTVPPGRGLGAAVAGAGRGAPWSRRGPARHGREARVGGHDGPSAIVIARSGHAAAPRRAASSSTGGTSASSTALYPSASSRYTVPASAQQRAWPWQRARSTRTRTVRLPSPMPVRRCVRARSSAVVAHGKSWREAQQLPRVQLDDPAHLLIGHIGEHLGRPGPAIGPVRVRVRVVRLPGDAVDPDVVAVFEAGHVIDEATPDVLTEQVRRARVEVDAGVVLVPLPRVVDALEQIGHPADAAFGQSHLQPGEPVKDG